MLKESVVRARARRRGYRLARSRIDGSYGLFDVVGNGWALGKQGRGYGYSLNEVAYFLGESVEVF